MRCHGLAGYEPTQARARLRAGAMANRNSLLYAVEPLKYHVVFPDISNRYIRRVQHAVPILWSGKNRPDLRAVRPFACRPHCVDKYIQSSGCHAPAEVHACAGQESPSCSVIAGNGGRCIASEDTLLDRHFFTDSQTGFRGAGSQCAACGRSAFRRRASVEGKRPGPYGTAAQAGNLRCLCIPCRSPASESGI